MNDIPITWPKKDEQLFKVDDDWYHNAHLNYKDYNWNLYSEGYKRAATLLIEHIKNNHFDQDTLVYPIVFLYRHYIELGLKEIIKYGSQLLDMPEEFPKHHKMDGLWKQCRIILKQETLCTRIPEEQLNAVEECIQQLSEKDPESFAFRYPTDKNGNPSLSGLEHINLINFSEVMERIATFFDGVITGVYVLLDQKREIRSEYL